MLNGNKMKKRESNNQKNKTQVHLYVLVQLVSYNQLIHMIYKLIGVLWLTKEYHQASEEH